MAFRLMAFRLKAEATRIDYRLLKNQNTTTSSTTPPIHMGRSWAKLVSTHDTADRTVMTRLSRRPPPPPPPYSPMA
jgi:hypothetical protein